VTPVSDCGDKGPNALLLAGRFPILGHCGRQSEALALSPFPTRGFFSTLLERVFEDYASISFGGAALVNLVLFGLGVVYAIRTARGWLRRQEGSGASLAIIATGACTALPSLLTPLDWDRYYLLAVLFSTVFIAIGISWAIQGAWGILPSGGNWGRFFRQRSGHA